MNYIKTYLKKPYVLVMLLGLVISASYLSLTQVTVTAIVELAPSNELTSQFQPDQSIESWQRYHYYRITLYSRITQQHNFNIIADDKVIEVRLGDNTINPKFAYPETRTSYRDAVLGDLYQLPVAKGESHVVIKTLNKGGPYGLKMAPKLDFMSYFIALICLLTPITWLCVNAFTYSVAFNSKVVATFKRIPLAYYLIFFAIVLRIFYVYQRGHSTFQHDYHGHIEYIKFIAQQWFIPLPHKAWEFPQQPLYYLIAGALFNFCQLFDASDDQFLWVLASLTVAISSVALVYAYRLVKRLTADTNVHNLTIAFLAFTPSLVYMSARISNDPLAATLVVVTLFYLIRSYQQQFTRYFYPALLFCSALFLTKISTVAIELLFFVLLLISYFKAPEAIKGKLYQFAAIGFILLSYTLYNAYYPAAQTFHFVNSGIWGGQDLRPLTLDYFFSFNFSELYQQGEALIGDQGIKMINRSFLTYQYGTMFFGEFGYGWWRQFNAIMMPLQQAIIALGLVIVLGWLSFVLLSKSNLLERLLAGVCLISLALVVKFIFEFPSMSNTDFRYYTTVFFILAYFFARGITDLAKIHPVIKRLVFGTSALLFLLEAVFIGVMASI